MLQSKKGLLPREGLYIDPIAKILRRTLFHPTLNLVFIVFIILYPPESFSFLIRLSTYGSIIGLVLWANDLLSERSHNNWVEDCSWDWGKEIVVVTGGSGGIGGSLVQLLAKDGVRTVVLDIIKPTYNTGMYPFVII